MSNILFRPHRGSLDAAMADVREVSCLDELVKIINTEIKPCYCKLASIDIKPYAYDDRINWDTYIVTATLWDHINDCPGESFVAGFTNSLFNGENNMNLLSSKKQEKIND